MKTKLPTVIFSSADIASIGPSSKVGAATSENVHVATLPELVIRRRYRREHPVADPRFAFLAEVNKFSKASPVSEPNDPREITISRKYSAI